MPDDACLCWYHGLCSHFVSFSIMFRLCAVFMLVVARNAFFLLLVYLLVFILLHLFCCPLLHAVSCGAGGGCGLYWLVDLL